jgi:hypothetical protein
MTRDDIIRLAREAGVFSGANEKVFSESLERFAALVELNLLRMLKVEPDKNSTFPTRPVQVQPLEFVEAVLEKEHLVGKPLMWAQWPNEEKK